MQLPVYSLGGEVVSQAEVSDLVFGIVPNLSVMHQALVRQQANARLGTHNTLTRSHVAGGGKKPYRQKGTGRARQGSIRAPHYRGGGVVFGPHPRKYTQSMPRKMRRLALRSALSQKVAEQRLLLVSGLAQMEPRTKVMSSALVALKVGASGVLVATNGTSEAARRAGGNLRNVKLVHAANLSIADVLKYDYLVIANDAVQPLQAVLLDGVREADGPSAGEVRAGSQSVAGDAFVLTPSSTTNTEEESE